MVVLAVLRVGKVAADNKLHMAISKRIMELDDDVETLKERREFGWVSPREVTQINRLIKLFNETIKELQAQL